MKRKFRPGRLAVVVAVFIALLSAYSAVLYKMQIYDPQRASAETGQMPLVTTKYTEVINAGRGEILDRNGERLVSSRASYNVSMSREALNASGRSNDIITQMLALAAKNSVRHNDTFPVTEGAPYEFVYDMSTQQRSTLDKYFAYFGLDTEITASDLIVWLKKHYEIPYTVGVSEARLIIGVRYELETRAIVTNLSPYVFAEDVPLDFVSTVSELSLPGVSVTTGSVRTYHTPYAAHLLGHIGKMNDEEMAYYTELGYPMDALVGREGVESAFEEYLHGADGKRVYYTTADGAVVSEEITEPVPGQNTYLTIELGVQEAAERALADVIANINLLREEGDKSTGGAVVALEVKTGQTLALASYPTFDPATKMENYTALANDANEPLYNRATLGTYNPGSTFKPVTALAGMRAGVISRYTLIEDQGIFTKYDDYRPRCWLYTSGFGASHGKLDVVGAIAHSCNYFFYTVGDGMGPSRIAQAAYDFGFGEKTGLEISESTGVVASEESRWEILKDVWHPADTLITAIGQGLNEFTPVQIANYAATIASGGTLRNLTLLRSVKTSDYTGTVYESVPETRSEIEETDLVAILREGMRSVVTYGTASDMFGNYPVAVAAKTGTVQTGADFNNGVFICYAPADDPEIAVAVVVQKGGSGAAIMEVAKAVLDEYFTEPSTIGVAAEGTLIR